MWIIIFIKNLSLLLSFPHFISLSPSLTHFSLTICLSICISLFLSFFLCLSHFLSPFLSHLLSLPPLLISLSLSPLPFVSPSVCLSFFLSLHHRLSFIITITSTISSLCSIQSRFFSLHLFSLSCIAGSATVPPPKPSALDFNVWLIQPPACATFIINCAVPDKLPSSDG